MAVKIGIAPVRPHSPASFNSLWPALKVVEVSPTTIRIIVRRWYGPDGAVVEGAKGRNTMTISSTEKKTTLPPSYNIPIALILGACGGVALALFQLGTGPLILAGIHYSRCTQKKQTIKAIHQRA